jgi:molecular chaperone DnaK
MDHDGDQRLGGQDVDAAIIERYFLPKLPDGLRKKVKPRESTAWWKLKRAAEDAKIRLSGLPRNQPALAHTDFPEEDGYEFRCSLSHEQLEAAMEPVITKSIAICKRFVAKLGLQPAAVHRVILVGGPTLSPYVRERVGRELGIPVDFRVDPLTAVAKGAAIYATTVPWEESDTAKAEAEVRANLDYPRQTQDSAPTVAGGLKDAAGTKVWTGWHVEVTHLDAGGTADWTSGKVAVNDAGAFVLKVRCDEPDREANEQERENRFRLAVTDPTGREVRTEYVGGFTIKVGMEVGSIRLPHGIGVVEADGSVCWYFDAGRPLPCERTIPTKTTRALKRGVSGAEAVRIPVVEEGVDRSKGKYNWPIGTLEVVAEKVFADIPVRSAVEVTIAVSKERRITVTAFFPTYQVETQTTFTGDIIPPTRETLAKDLEIVRKAIGAMEPLVGDSEDIRRVLAEVREGGILDEVAKLVAESSTANPDAAMKAKELLMRIEKLLDPVVPVINRLTAWRAAWHEFQENVAKCTRALKARGRNVSPAQRMEFNDLVKQFEDACDRRDLQEATGLAMRAIPSLVTAITGLEAKPVDGLTKVDEIETRKGDDGDTQSGP